MAKGRDLDEAAVNVDSAKDLRTKLKQKRQKYAERLESLREKIEGAVQLHHLLGLDLKEKDVQHEMQKLAEKIGAIGLIERCRDSDKRREMTKMQKPSTPTKEHQNNCNCWRNDSHFESNNGQRDGTAARTSSGEVSPDDDEDHSKMADSGLGSCDRCEGNDKLTRTCSCHSFDESATVCSKRWVEMEASLEFFVQKTNFVSQKYSKQRRIGGGLLRTQCQRDEFPIAIATECPFVQLRFGFGITGFRKFQWTRAEDTEVSKLYLSVQWGSS